MQIVVRSSWELFVVQMQHAIALLGDECVVRDDDADLVFADLLQSLKHALCGGFIEVCGGLVEHQDRGVVERCLRPPARSRSPLFFRLQTP